MRTLVAVIAATLLVVAACSSGGDSADPDPSVTATDTTIDTGSSLDDSSIAEPTSPTVTTTEPTSSTVAEADTSQFVDLYFVQGNGHATPVATAVPSLPGVAAQAILALIAGPTPAQASEGLYTSIPPDTELLDLTIADSIARIDLSREFEAGAGTFSMSSRLAQVVYTLTSFSTVNAVEFWLEGEPVTVFSTEGLVLDGPLDRIDVLADLPLTPTALTTVALWEQADLPDISRFADTARVVLVPTDDVLNVRMAAGVDNRIIGMLTPGIEVALTGRRADVESSTWAEIVTPAGVGWVNSRFLAGVVSDEAFRTDDRVISLLDQLSRVLDAEGDLTGFASVRGLYVSHHGPLIRFRPAQLEGILTDPTTYRWPSNAINMDDPEAVEREIPARSFAEAIAASFVSTWDDADRRAAFDEPLTGGNGRRASDAIPSELAGFHFVSAFDPGDNPNYGGLDWTSWHMSIDYEDGEPVVVGMTLDQWSP